MAAVWPLSREWCISMTYLREYCANCWPWLSTVRRRWLQVSDHSKSVDCLLCLYYRSSSLQSHSSASKTVGQATGNRNRNGRQRHHWTARCQGCRYGVTVLFEVSSIGKSEKEMYLINLVFNLVSLSTFVIRFCSSIVLPLVVIFFVVLELPWLE